MAKAPMPPAPPPSAAAAPAGGMMGADPSAAAGTDPTAGASDSDGGSDVVVTICSNGDGTYTVYAGDEPDPNSGDMSGDDADAMGGAGDATAAPPAQGQPADSIGAALKAALDILQSDASSQGAPGSADDQFNAGFSASKSPTPASGSAQKY